MGSVEGNLRIHAPFCIGAKHLHGIVMAFQRHYPDVTVDLMLDNRDVDLVYENFDIAIKYGRPADQELIIRRLGLIRRILVASPEFLARFGPIDVVERLSEGGIITTVTLLASRDLLTLRHISGEIVDVPVRTVLRTNNAGVITASLIEGLAAGPVQQLLVSDELARGAIRRSPSPLRGALHAILLNIF